MIKKLIIILKEKKKEYDKISTDLFIQFIDGK
jgi:hypothetical protein